MKNEHIRGKEPLPHDQRKQAHHPATQIVAESDPNAAVPTHRFTEAGDTLQAGLTLTITDDPAARSALEIYATETTIDAFAANIRAWVDRCDDTDGGSDD